MHAELTVGRWRALAEHLITKYNDGYVRDEQGNYPDVGYPGGLAAARAPRAAGAVPRSGGEARPAGPLGFVREPMS